MKLQFLLFLALIIFLWSCNDDDDDQDVPTPFSTQVSVSSATTEAEEGATVNINFTLSEANTTGTDLAVAYTVSGTASNTDYTGASGSITFSEGQNTAQLELVITDDDAVEEIETITITIEAGSLPEGLSVGSPSSITITILDNDFPYANGVFVLNEGNFGSGNGSISFLGESASQLENGIFNSVNDFNLGDIVQSMTISGSEAYIIVNASNKVEVVNFQTFESVVTITEQMANPRHMVTRNGVGYLSNWGNFDANFALDQSYIAAIDLSTHSVADTIHVGDGADNLIIVDDKLFVSINFGNTVEVIDLATHSVVASMQVGNAPGQFTWTGEELWVICGGTFNGNDGQLYQLDVADYSVLRKEDLGFNPSTKTAYDPDNNNLYFYSGNTVYQFNPDLDVDPAATPYIENPDFVGLYGIGFDNQQDQILLGDAVGFAGAGMVYVYSQNGTIIDSFTSGVGPNGFVITPE